MSPKLRPTRCQGLAVMTGVSAVLRERSCLPIPSRDSIPREAILLSAPRHASMTSDVDDWRLHRALREVLRQPGLWLVAISPANRGRSWPSTGDSDTGVAGREPDIASDPDRSQPTDQPRVLLVDDSAAMRAVLRGLLEDTGMLVVGEAADGLEGIGEAEALRPDVVVMDWRMPRLNGVQAAARLRRELPEVAVVLFSVVEGEQAETIAREAGAVALLHKGVPAEQVCAAVRAAWRPRVPYPDSKRS
jgi:CheY-like chemotaxis protein